MLGGNCDQHRPALFARQAVLPGEHRVPKIPHHDHCLVAIDAPIDNRVTDLGRQPVQDPARPEDVLTTDDVTQRGHQ